MWKPSAAHYVFLRIIVAHCIHIFVYSLQGGGDIILVQKYYIRSEMDSDALHNKKNYDKLRTYIEICVSNNDSTFLGVVH
jgi:hypothetical protein